PAEVKDVFYNQVSWHIGTRPNTDFSWAMGWAKPAAGAVLRPLGAGIPGSVLQSADGATRAVVAPWLKPAVEAQTEGLVYNGWAGAATQRPDGATELIQMYGNVIGVPRGARVHGDGPFRAVVKGSTVAVETGGRARWLEFHGLRAKRVTLDGRKAATEPAGPRGAVRVAIPAGRHRVSVAG
ncbi:MAG: hypothetical protein IT195_14085, partial [Microthrixaceae bacterium]|nr:hypothetical protein [Microthrixaceae bacterium]